MVFDSDEDKKLFNLLTHEIIHTQQPKVYLEDKMKGGEDLREALIEAVTECETEYRLNKAGRPFFFDNPDRRPNTGRYKGYKAILNLAWANDPEVKRYSWRHGRRMISGSLEEAVDYVSTQLFGKPDAERLHRLVLLIHDRVEEIIDLPDNNQVIQAWLREQLDSV